MAAAAKMLMQRWMQAYGIGRTCVCCITGKSHLCLLVYWEHTPALCRDPQQ